MTFRAGFNLLIILLIIQGCKNKQASEQKVNIDQLTKDFQTWWTYQYHSVRLSSDFKALDTAYKIINKEAFLKELTTGNYIPVNVTGKDSSLQYILCPIPPTADKSINTTISGTANEALERFKREGEPFPAFSWVDINKATYTTQNMKGKIVVLKFWFIHCVPCVQEMPSVNEIVKEYADRKDVQFISLAFDSKNDLQAFVKKIKFLYPVVPVKQSYVMNDLAVTSFPTHMIINKEGKIVKVVSRYEEMAEFLRKEAGK